jgi:predicted permease
MLVLISPKQVFGNSNSLPISLVISLSQTLKGLHWAKIPGDNDDEVGARGILYLLIFQQLGQLLRWSWGYRVLLAPAEAYSDEDSGRINGRLEGGYRDESDTESEAHDALLSSGSSQLDVEIANNKADPDDLKQSATSSQATYSGYESGSTTPEISNSALSSASFDKAKRGLAPVPANGNAVDAGPGNLAGRFHRYDSAGHITTFPDPATAGNEQDNISGGLRGRLAKSISFVKVKTHRATDFCSRGLRYVFSKLPAPVRKALSTSGKFAGKFLAGVWSFMNPPLWAMLVAIVVASVPKLQHLFFDEGTFLSNSVTRAVSQSGGVAVPLILVVLGANLAQSTATDKDLQSKEEQSEERKLLIASLISRMLIPTIIMAPLLALTAKFVPVSILGDPIFVIVCFLLTGAPSALQIAQICQVNNVYMGTMSRILFQSYVVWYVCFPA